MLATSFTQAHICFSKFKHTCAFMKRVILNMKPGKCISISLFKIIISIFIEQFCLLHKQGRSLHFVWWRKCFKHDKKAGSFYLTLLILKFKIIGKSLISNSQSLQHLSEYQILLLSQNLFVDPVKLCSLKALLLQWHISWCCFVRIA